MNKIVSFLLLALLLAPAAAQTDRPPNILLIVTDDQRPDTIRALGNTRIDTPNLDRLVSVVSHLDEQVGRMLEALRVTDQQPSHLRPMLLFRVGDNLI